MTVGSVLVSSINESNRLFLVISFKLGKLVITLSFAEHKDLSSFVPFLIWTEFSLNVLKQFTEFSDINIVFKRLFEPEASCVRDWDAKTASARNS